MRIVIHVNDRTRGPVSRIAKARVFSRRTLEMLARSPEFRQTFRGKRVHLNIHFLSSHSMRRLAERYRGKRHAANVLSFPSYSSQRALRSERAKIIDLGDVMLAPDVIAREASEQGNQFYAQFFWMLAHGILHVVGYVHERGGASRARMEALEDRLLQYARRRS